MLNVKLNNPLALYIQQQAIAHTQQKENVFGQAQHVLNSHLVLQLLFLLIVQPIVKLLIIHAQLIQEIQHAKIRCVVIIVQ